jgi:hypothetical protein
MSTMINRITPLSSSLTFVGFFVCGMMCRFGYEINLEMKKGEE